MEVSQSMSLGVQTTVTVVVVVVGAVGSRAGKQTTGIRATGETKGLSPPCA